MRHGLILRREQEVGAEKQLSQQFENNRQLLEREERKPQEVFAQEVSASFDQALPTFIEAQAGRGKTNGNL
ncbi:hypothetical protein [Streptococcus hyointestinalis]|uniref:hypothetical protein n=1 Tax=Streptococcus hyointestinalis TaxID=1337 RepID=UPI001F152E1C|nr:hypothetical protein [Streptococcus hyointestinalis]